MRTSRILFIVGLFLIAVATAIYVAFAGSGSDDASSAQDEGQRDSYGALTVPSAHYEYFKAFYSGVTVADTSGGYHGTASEALEVYDDGTL
jgi:hypothetical protein